LAAPGTGFPGLRDAAGRPLICPTTGLKRGFSRSSFVLTSLKSAKNYERSAPEFHPVKMKNMNTLSL
jgi:hypothetical protein